MDSCPKMLDKLLQFPWKMTDNNPKLTKKNLRFSDDTTIPHTAAYLYLECARSIFENVSVRSVSHRNPSLTCKDKIECVICYIIAWVWLDCHIHLIINELTIINSVDAIDFLTQTLCVVWRLMSMHMRLLSVRRRLCLMFTAKYQPHHHQ